MNRVKHPNASLGQKVVTVIGGGFAGLSVAKYLAGKQDVFVVLGATFSQKEAPVLSQEKNGNSARQKWK